MSTDAELAAELAEQAGALLLDLRREIGTVDPVELGNRGDQLANTFLLDRLASARPDDAVLSEESSDDLTRLDAERVWIIDPLDGTREYSRAGRPDWAVHVALWQRGRGITAAAVAQPALGAVYRSDRAESPVASRGRMRLLVSDTRPPAFADALAEAIGAELVPMGSAGAKAMAVLRGDADAYVHAGGQFEWDSAAPVGVVLAAGLHASRIDGAGLRYNQPDPYLPDLLISRPDVAETILEALARRHSAG